MQREDEDRFLSSYEKLKTHKDIFMFISARGCYILLWNR